MFKRKYTKYKIKSNQYGGYRCGICYRQSKTEIIIPNELNECINCGYIVCSECLAKIKYICPQEKKYNNWKKIDRTNDKYENDEMTTKDNEMTENQKNELKIQQEKARYDAFILAERANKSTQKLLPELDDPLNHELINGIFDSFGFDIEGFDREGFNRVGYDREGYYRDGFNRAGFNRDGFNRAGFNRAGFNKFGFDYEGYDVQGFNNKGIDKGGFNRARINIETGTPYNKSGYDYDGYNENGYNEHGCHKSEPYRCVIGDFVRSHSYKLESDSDSDSDSD